MLRPFVQVVSLPGVAVPLTATVVGAVPIGMGNLGILLAVRSGAGSFAEAGLVAAAFMVGNAAGLAVQGRLIDALGQPRVLIPAGILCAIALCGLAAAVGTSPVPVMMALSTVGGAALPATTTSMRALLPGLVNDPDLRRTAYALLSTQFTAAMVAGPLIVSALMVWTTPAVVVAATGLTSGMAGVLFAATSASRQSQRKQTGSRTTGRGVVSTPGLVVLVGAAFGGGLMTGLAAVATPAAATIHNATQLAGVMMACISMGEILSGLLFGSRRWRARSVDLLVRFQLASVGAHLLLATAAGTLAMMFPLLFLTGCVLAPISILSSTLLDNVAAADALASTYATTVAVGLIGIAIGNALGGTLVTTTPAPAYLSAVVIGVATVGWTAHGRCKLHTPTPCPHTSSSGQLHRPRDNRRSDRARPKARW